MKGVVQAKVVACAAAFRASARQLHFAASSALLCLLLASPEAFAPPPVKDEPRADKEGFTLAVEPRAFEFPRDHGPHPDFRHEWWYVTGNLHGAQGERMGFELTIFRFALTPPAQSAEVSTSTSTSASASTSQWRTRQIYMAHFAVTDVPAKRF